MKSNPDFTELQRTHGIYFDGAMGGAMDYVDMRFAANYVLANDAQPGLITTMNNGIPAFLSNYIDPKVITVLTTPNNGAKLLGEVQKGDWVTRTMTFPMVESTGETSAYGDWNNNGSVSANVDFPQRQSFHYQTITQWGQKQLAEAALAKIDWSQRLNIASAMVLDKFQNNSYFYGIGGLQNYGMLTDPQLPAAITPVTKAAGGTTWAVATPNELYADFQKLFNQLTTQTNGLITQDTKLVFATTPGAMMWLSSANSFGVTPQDLLRKGFPNIRFETAPQYGIGPTGAPNGAGTVVQLFAEEIDGQETGYCAFTEKMRAHPIVADVSSYKQKKSQGTWGAIIFLPVAFAQMVGV